MSGALAKFKDKIVVIGSTQCPACKALKKEFESSNVEDVEFLNVEESEEARVLAEGLGIMSYPTIVAFEEMDDGKLVACILDKDLKPERCFEVSGEDESGGEG